MHRGLFISACNACSSKLPYAAQEVYRQHRTWAFLHLPASIVLHCPASFDKSKSGYTTWIHEDPPNHKTFKIGREEDGGGMTSAACLGQDVLITLVLCCYLCEMPYCFPLNSINPYHQYSPKWWNNYHISHHSGNCCDCTYCDCSGSRHSCGPLQNQEEEAKLSYEQDPENYYR